MPYLLDLVWHFERMLRRKLRINLNGKCDGFQFCHDESIIINDIRLNLVYPMVLFEDVAVKVKGVKFTYAWVLNVKICGINTAIALYFSIGQ